MAARTLCDYAVSSVGAGQPGRMKGGSGACVLPSSEQSLFQGIDISLGGLAELAPSASATLKAAIKTNLAGLDRQVAAAALAHDPARPDVAANRLGEGLAGLDAFIKTVEGAKPESLAANERFNLLHELRIKRAELNNALVLALGLTFSPRLVAAQPAFGDPAQLVANEPLRVEPNLAGSRPVQFAVTGIALEAAPGLLSTVPVTATNLTLSQSVAAVPAPTRPYFSRRNLEQPFYDVTDPDLRNAPATPAPLVEAIRLTYQGATVEMRAAVLPPAAPPAQAQISAPVASPMQLAAVPAISMQLVPSVGIVPLTTASTDRIALTGIVRANVPATSGSLRLQLPPGWKAESSNAPAAPGQPTSLKRDRASRWFRRGAWSRGSSLTSSAQLANFRHAPASRESFRPVGYPGLPYTNSLHSRHVPGDGRGRHHGHPISVSRTFPVPAIPSPSLLPNLGISPTLIIALADVSLGAKLKQFDAVLLGVRAYAAHPELAGAGSKPLAGLRSPAAE